MLPPTPYGVFIVGDHLMAAGEGAQLWSRNVRAGAPWTKIALGGAYTVRGFECARDSQCVVLATVGTTPRTFLVNLATSRAKPLPVQALSTIWFKNARTLYYVAAADEKGRSVHAFDVATGKDRMVTTLAPGEMPISLPINGKIVLFAHRYDGSFRSIDEAKPLQFRMPLTEGFLTSRSGEIEFEFWASNAPMVRGDRTITLTSLQPVDGGGVRATKSVLAAFPVDGPLPITDTLTIDANNDLAAVFAGPQGRSVGVICNDKGRTFKPLLQLEGDETASLASSHMGNGFVIATHSLSHSKHYRILRLSPATDGFAGRQCASTKAIITEADVSFDSNAARFSKTLYTTTSADGTRIPYYVLAAKGHKPKHVIMDVYGADGLARDFPFYHQHTQDYLLAHDTAMAFPIVRGDGDFGYAFAMASKPPQRMKAVADVVAVAKDLSQRFPSLAEKPIVRGGSAGAWLAVKSALSQPDAFSGAIGISGPYLLKSGQSAMAGHSGFITESEDLTADLAAIGPGCRGLHFRFLNAKDDLKVSYGKALLFYGMLRKQSCNAAFISFETGGHAISIPLSRPQDQKRKFLGYFAAF